MHPVVGVAYEGAARTATFLARVGTPPAGKLGQALRARRGILDRFTRWGREYRDPARPLIWIHASSAGEGLQARPLLELARRSRPEVQLAFSFFSPSAEVLAAALDVDFRDYLPFDTAAAARVALDALRPTCLVFAKLDVWPTLVREAAHRAIPIGLVSASVAPGSSRRSLPARLLLHDAYASLDVVGAVSETDAKALIALGVRPGAISVTGDTRYDQVWARAGESERRQGLIARLASPRPTIVAGSTWPSDERRLLTAFALTRSTVGAARLVIAPHEPTASHLEPVERWAAEHRVTLARLGAAAAESADVVLVDRVGVLGELYALADVAFVGGGFHGSGLHSVLEPAAFGAPVVFGPRHHDSRDAAALLAAGGGAVAAGTQELAAVFQRWLGDTGLRRATGRRARDVVRSGLGAGVRSLAVVERLLDGR